MKSFIENFFDKETIKSGVFESYDHNLFRTKCITVSINFIEKRTLLSILFMFYGLQPPTDWSSSQAYDEHCSELRNILISERRRVTEWKLN